MTPREFELREDQFTPKELSWLSFNARLLQEASNPDVPPIERMKFLGIYSSNLDEFFRVRVATLRRLAALGSRSRGLVLHDPKEVLDQVLQGVRRQHKRYEALFHKAHADLAEHGIHVVDETGLDDEQSAFVTDYFRSTVRQRLHPIMVTRRSEMPDLRDRCIYMAVVLSDSAGKRKQRYALVEVPTDILPRFLVLPPRGDQQYVIYLDDVIRHNLSEVFSLFLHDVHEAYQVKISKDADLDLDDDLQESYMSRISRGLKRREKASPVWLVYDQTIPIEFLNLILRKLRIPLDGSLVPGGRYHNRSDLMGFPDLGVEGLTYRKYPTIPHPSLPEGGRYLRALRKRDVLLWVPYHDFSHVLTLLREAALDPKVSSIQVALYRVARHSSVVTALINALRNGKDVTVIMELQARFDEEANILWTERLREEGARVMVGVPGLKVHAKICLITRRERGKDRKYACIGTGNYNEDTARIFSDMMLMTADPALTEELDDVFRLIRKPYRPRTFENLLVSPVNMRSGITARIDKEVVAAQEGREAWIDVKMNNLSDDRIVAKLYEASAAGVRVRLNVRGMYSLKAGVPGMSENIEAMALIDRYLEHGRIIGFANDGDPEVWIGSADWLPRNFDKRIEVMTPIRDPGHKQLLCDMFELQWRDNRQARILDPELKNEFRPADEPAVRSQTDAYDLIRGDG